MRKILNYALCFLICFSMLFLAACQGNETNKEKTSKTTAQEAVKEEKSEVEDVKDEKADVEDKAEEEKEEDKETKATKDEQKVEVKEDKQELKKITVILDYVVNTNHSGLYLAKERGYYEDAGLDVEIIEPQESTSLQVLAAKKADFAISYQEDLTYALDQDEPLPLKAIAAIIQNNTSGFASLAEKNIKSSKDFEDLTYAGWGSPAETAIIQAAMKNAGLDPDKMEFVTAMDTSYASLKGDIDLMWFFEAWDLIAAKMEGLELNYIPCRDIDERLNYYTPIIVARNEMIENDPELVKAFMQATQKAYEEACDKANVDEIVEIMTKNAPAVDAELLSKSQSYLADEYMKGSERWGLMQDKVWTGYAEFMKEYELIEEVLEPSAYYTNEFLEK